MRGDGKYKPANKYKKIRQENNLSCKQWSDLFSVPIDTVLGWENGTIRVDYYVKLLMTFSSRELRNAIVKAKKLELIDRY
jgi:DNA-binding transcriptional regulator YiaG